MDVEKTSAHINIPWQKSLVTQLTTGSVVIVVAVLLAVGGGLIWIAQKSLQQTTFLLQEKNADKVAFLISNHISNALDTLRLFDNVELLSKLPTINQKEALENILIQRQSLFSQFIMLNAQGGEQFRLSRFHTFLPHELGSQAKSPAFLSVASRRTYVSPVYISPDSGLLSVQMAVPIYRAGKVTNVLIGEMDARSLWQKVSNIRIGKTGYAYLVDNRGRFVAYQETATVLQRYGEDMTKMPPVADFIGDDNKETRTVHEYNGLRGDPVIGLYTPIQGTNWAVVVEMPVREAYAGIINMRWYLTGLMLLGIIITCALGIVVYHRLVEPLRSLAVSAQRIGSGDLDTEVVQVQRGDEVGLLARSFQSMQQELSTLYRGLKRQVAELKRAEDEILKLNQELEKRVTERTEELQHANKELESFSYSVSHDLRSPLRAIDGFLNIMVEECGSSINDSAKHYMDLARTNVQHMFELIEALLNLSRLGRQALVKQNVSFSEIAKQVLSELLVSEEERNVETTVQDIPVCLADPALMKVVYVNLLSNALKYSRNKDISIIEIGYRKEGDELVYFVKDNGAGFDMRYEEKLFGVFQRLHSKKEFEGQGVGLSIVKRIIQRHGGRIWVDSLVGQGTTFFFTLERKQATKS